MNFFSFHRFHQDSFWCVSLFFLILTIVNFYLSSPSLLLSSLPSLLSFISSFPFSPVLPPSLLYLHLSLFLFLHLDSISAVLECQKAAYPVLTRRNSMDGRLQWLVWELTSRTSTDDFLSPFIFQLHWRRNVSLNVLAWKV